MRITRNIFIISNKKIQQNQNDSISLFGQGMCLSALNRNNEAIDSYKAALSHIQPHDSLTYYIKGTLHYIFFELDIAIECFKQSIEHDANLAMAYNGLGNCLRRQNKFDEAIEEFKQAIKRDQCDDVGGGDHLKIESRKRIRAQATHNQGNCLRRLNKLDEAILCYNQALELDEMYAEAFNNKGLCLLEQKKFNDAYILFEKAISIDFNYAHAHYNKGKCLRNLKRRDEAILSFDLALDINKTYVKALNNKGIFLVEINKPIEALACFTSAILLEQNYQLAKENKNILSLAFPDVATKS